jgi:hypothetical protein
MSGTLEKLYAGAKRAEAAKRAKNGGRKPKVKRAKAKGGKKPKSKPKTGKRKANKKVKILAESLASRCRKSWRHGRRSCSRPEWPPHSPWCWLDQLRCAVKGAFETSKAEGSQSEAGPLST